MFDKYSFWQLLAKGGVVEVVLGIISVISITLILERAWAFYKFSSSLRVSADTLKDTIRKSGVVVAAGLSEAQKGPVSAMFLSGFEKKQKGAREIADAMELSGRNELARLDRYVGVIGTIGSTAPFIGLFGTVLGIIRAFSDLAAAQGASPAAVADGIAEALVATATGLFVAIPAVMAYNYFVRTAARNALKMETLASEFVDALSEGGRDGVEDAK